MAKRLVVFVEGKGDVQAVPTLAQRVVDWLELHDALFVDFEPFRVRGIGALVKNNCFDWHRWLGAAGKTRANLGAVLLVLDGDVEYVAPSWASYVDRFGSTVFCEFHAAAMLGYDAREARAGDQFSVATVFARKEFEAWLLAGVESLRGASLTDGRGKVPAHATCPVQDPEAVRDAKGELRRLIPDYQQSLDQGVLAKRLDLERVHVACRSFQRFCSAIQQLADAIRQGRHVITPNLPAA